MSGKSILFFAKFPEEGRVKTRLARTITNTHAVELYRNFVLDLNDSLSTLSLDAHINACIAPAESLQDFKKWLDNDNYTYIIQQGKNLGEKLKNAFKDQFDKGIEKVIVIGSDVPGINNSIIKSAFNILSTHDAVIGPSFDGGYYLLGLTKKSYNPIIFDNIAWSTDLVLQQTLDKLNLLKFKYRILNELQDIDTFTDLVKYYTSNSNQTTRSLEYMNKILNEVTKVKN